MARQTRRRFLLAVSAGAAALAGCTGTSGTSADGSTPAFDGWLSDMANFDGVVDATGQPVATVTVGGADDLSFDPAAVRVNAGTTVRWEWAGGGAAHNVAARDGAFASEYHTEAGATFERTFKSEGVVKYLCVPHEYAGMKGVVVVGV